MTKIQQFFLRIGMDPDTPIEYSVDFLGQIQQSCVTSIAYENLSILQKCPLDLSPEGIYDKIITRGQGGYCFELNGLLSFMLKEMKFAVTERFSRFLRGETSIPMRRHRITVVTLEDGDYMMDIGVGQVAPRSPLKIEAGLIQVQGQETYKFEKDLVHGWILYDLHLGHWREYICFTDDVAYDVDFLQPSFFCEAHPDSVFNKAPMLAIKTSDGRCTIDGQTYKVFRGDELLSIEENISDDRMNELLHQVFKLL